MKSKTAFICAMRKEFELLKSTGIPAVLSGIGKVNAAVATEKMIQGEHPECIISIGVAGTFDESLNEGDIVIASRVAYHDVWCGEGNKPGQVQGFPPCFESDASLLKCARKALPDVRVGLICSGDQFYIGREEDERQRALFPDVLAVDMEAAAVAQVCHMHGVPFLAVKIISDNHLRPSQKAQYEDFWDSLAEDSFEMAAKILHSIQEKYG